MPIQLRQVRALAALLAVFALSSCMLAAGKFTSTLDIRRDGQFAFTYTGEIAVLALAKPPGEARGTFTPVPCYGNEADSGTERACTREEIASQKQAWEQSRANALASDRQQAQTARAMFGGLDFDDPRAGEELARRLRQQQGWRRVEYLGRGVYRVDYAANGKLGHDFTFPTIERFALANPFVQLINRADGAVRVDAPGFSTVGTSMVNSMMMGAATAVKGKEGPSTNLPPIDGTFSLTTDGEVLANNTENGPGPAEDGKRGQQLTWRITTSTDATPMALIRLGN